MATSVSLNMALTVLPTFKRGNVSGVSMTIAVSLFEPASISTKDKLPAVSMDDILPEIEFN